MLIVRYTKLEFRFLRKSNLTLMYTDMIKHKCPPNFYINFAGALQGNIDIHIHAFLTPLRAVGSSGTSATDSTAAASNPTTDPGTTTAGSSSGSSSGNPPPSQVTESSAGNYDKKKLPRVKKFYGHSTFLCLSSVPQPPVLPHPQHLPAVRPVNSEKRSRILCFLFLVGTRIL